MYDVEARNIEVLSEIDALKKMIKSGEVDGIMISVRFRDASHKQSLFRGTAPLLEWIGSLESFKTKLIQRLWRGLEDDD